MKKMTKDLPQKTPLDELKFRAGIVRDLNAGPAAFRELFAGSDLPIGDFRSFDGAINGLKLFPAVHVSHFENGRCNRRLVNLDRDDVILIHQSRYILYTEIAKTSGAIGPQIIEETAGLFHGAYFSLEQNSPQNPAIDHCSRQLTIGASIDPLKLIEFAMRMEPDDAHTLTRVLLAFQRYWPHISDRLEEWRDEWCVSNKNFEDYTSQRVKP